jgi:hypothetical protein
MELSFTTSLEFLPFFSITFLPSFPFSIFFILAFQQVGSPWIIEEKKIWKTNLTNHGYFGQWAN